MSTPEALPPLERPFLHRMRIRAGVALGLLYLIGPIADLARSSLGPARITGIAIGLAAFVAIYWSLLPPADWLAQRGQRAIIGALAVMPVVAGALLLAGAPASFASLFVYFAAAAGLLLPGRLAVPVIGATALGVGVGAAVSGASDSEIAGLTLTIASIGILMAAFGRILRGNNELREAREELARLAVSEERLRIARELHDLLGHSLSVIALKSELAGRLVERDAARAAAELRDIEGVSRKALAEVREAVQGYRGLALTQALDGARDALTAAGIDYRVEDSGIAVPPDVEAVLASAVREGTTNVVRHSHATHCEIRLTSDRRSAAVEVADDGDAVSSSNGGTGLVGLAERARTVHGSLEAGAATEGGFRLRLTVPLAD